MRLEGQAKAGEYPAPLSAVRAIASMLQAPTPLDTTICDPFGSDGRTLNTLANALDIPSSHRYLAELKPANVATALQDGVGHAVACDSFSDLKASCLSMALVVSNPPFDWSNGGLHERTTPGTREELRALRLVLSPSKLNVLIPGGIHVVIGPEPIMLRADIRDVLATWHDAMTAWTFPRDERPFSEVLIIGVKRASARRDADALTTRMDVLADQIRQAEPLTGLPAPIYIIPPATRTGPIVWRHRQATAHQDVAQAIVKHGGIWTAPGWQHARAGLRQFVAAPLAPFNAEQAAMMVASGKFNNRTVTLGDATYLVKGFTSQKIQETATTATTTDKKVTTTEQITIPHPMISVRNTSTGEVTIYDGTDAVMQFVSQHADAFLTMAQDAAPAVYAPATPDPTVWSILDGITSHSGRKPRGANKPGLVERQKHAAAALVAGLTQPHPLTGTPLKGVVAAMEQRCGKCVVEGTLIPTERGMVTIESLMPAGTPEQTFVPLDVVVQTPDGPRHTSHFYNSGHKPTKRLQTRWGYEVTGTYVHPVLVLEPGGRRVWKQLAQVQPGDYVAVQRHDSVWGTQTELPSYQHERHPNAVNLRELSLPTHLTEDLAYWIGLLIGDGSMRHGSGTVGFTSADPALVHAFSSFLASLGLTLSKHPGESYDYRVASMMLKGWLNHLKVSNVKADQKVIPPCILQAPQPMVRAFLQGLFDTDGSAFKTGRIEFCSSSEELARHVHILLLQFGIVAARSYKHNATAGAWRLHINGEEARKFYDQVGFRLRRKQERQQYLIAGSESTNDRVPHLPNLTLGRYRAVPNTVRRFIRRGSSPSYHTLRRLAETYDEFRDLTSPEFFWDKVTSLSDAGVQPCYDLTVPGVLAFVSNGIVSHNTAVSLGVAEVLRQVDPPRGRQPRAYTVLVPAPRLVVGDKQQIRNALKGTGSLPAWYATWKDMLPDWHLAVLETPADVGAFFRSAQQNPDMPHVGFVPLSMVALGPGWAVMNGEESPTAPRRDRQFAAYSAEQAGLNVFHTDADATDDTDPLLPADTLPAGVSPRTIRRDAILHPAYRPRQHGPLRCPDCGRVSIDPEDGTPISGVDDMGAATCPWCGGRFAGWTRATQAKDSTVGVFRAWQGDYAQAADGTRLIPWGTRPTSNPRVPLAWLFKHRYKGQIDLLIFDEVHKSKGDGTAIGDAMFWAAEAARKVVYLTGTVMGGNALDTFNMYWSIANPILRRQFAFHERSRFVDVMGVKKTIITETSNASQAGVYNGRHSRRTTTETLPGLTINLVELVLTQTVMTQLTDMGFDLVPLDERKVLLAMPDDVAEAYQEAVLEYRAWMDKWWFRAASSGMQMLWQLPYRPDAPKAMRYVPRDPDTGEDLDPVTYTPEPITPQALPHHQWLAEYSVAQRRQGRRVLVYYTHTGDDNLMPSVQEWVTTVARDQHGMRLRGIQLYSDRDSTGSRVDSGTRDAWFRQKAAEDYDVVFANPACLDVGISLLDWPSIVFLEPHYSAFVVSQAMMRAWGPMQEQPCEVTFVAYQQTVSQAALGILAQKLAAMATLKGSIAKAMQGIAEFSGAMSVFKAIADIVADGRTIEEPALANCESFSVPSIPPMRPQPQPADGEPTVPALAVTVQLQIRKGKQPPITIEAQQWVMDL